jgi:hypothetical protein
MTLVTVMSAQICSSLPWQKLHQFIHKSCLLWDEL